MSEYLNTGDVIAYADGDGIVITWNGSATFNAYADGVEFDVFTAYGIDTIADAIAAAQSHIDDCATGMVDVLAGE